MKTKILGIISVFFVILLSLCVVSCDNDHEDYTQIQTENASYENGIYKIIVGSGVESHDIVNNFAVDQNVTYELSRSEDFSNVLESGVITLVPGDNMVYVRVSDYNDHQTVYKFNVYRKRIVTVTYNTNGGTSVDPVQIEEGSTIVAPETVKIGYTLSWSGHDFTQPVSSDITVNAEWTPNQYKIVIDAEGTELDKTEISVKYGDSIATLIPAVSKVGYTFTGWEYNGTDFNTDGLYVYTSDITIKAKLQAVEYNITYVVQVGGSVADGAPVKFTVADVIALEDFDAIWNGTTEYPSDEKVFAGWYTTADFKAGTEISEIKEKAENVTIYAKFDDVVFINSVKLMLGDTLIDTISLTYRKAYQIPDCPVDEHHIFNGWKLEGTAIPSEGASWGYKTEVILVADVTAREYDIEYVLDEGMVNPLENPSQFTADDEPFTLLPPTYPRHEFEGWYTDRTWTTRVEQITPEDAGKKITLYPKWTLVLNVEFNANGGDCELESTTFKYNQSYKLPNVSKTLYLFEGWYYNDTLLANEGTWTYKDDITLVARWKPISFTITYVLNGCENNPSNLLSYSAENGVFTLLDPEKLPENCAFEGWYLEASFENKITSIDPYEVADNITLHAKITKKQTVITYVPNGGTSEQQQVIDFNSNYQLFVPIRPGYTFDGWFNDEGVLCAIEGVWVTEEKTLTLTAKWTKNKYTITYVDADVESPTEFYIDSENITLPIPTKDGYIFEGWTADGSKPNRTVVITKGSTGNRTYTASWIKAKDDATGFTYDLVDGSMVVVYFDKAIDDSIRKNIYVPSTYCGYNVTAIGNKAFEDFGKKFEVTQYANAQFNHITIYLPTSINRVGAYAFTTCNGLKVNVYGTNDYISWDAGVEWELGNVSARDCVWGLRPAIGWTRYSNAPIPDEYYKNN